MIISHNYFRMRNVPDKSRRENQNTQFAFNIIFPKVVSFYEIMWKNMIKQGRS